MSKKSKRILSVRPRTPYQRTNLRNWVAALRSGNFAQGRGVLRKMEILSGGVSTYCCLVVACVLLPLKVAPHKLGEEPAMIEDNEAEENLGLSHIDQTSLAKLNDEGERESRNEEGEYILSPWTFAQIADLIERELLVEEDA